MADGSAVTLHASGFPQCSAVSKPRPAELLLVIDVRVDSSVVGSKPINKAGQELLKLIKETALNPQLQINSQ